MKVGNSVRWILQNFAYHEILVGRLLVQNRQRRETGVAFAKSADRLRWFV